MRCSEDGNRARRDDSWPPWRVVARDSGGTVVLAGLMTADVGCRVGISREAGNISGNQGDQPDACDGPPPTARQEGILTLLDCRLSGRHEVQMKVSAQFIHVGAWPGPKPFQSAP